MADILPKHVAVQYIYMYIYIYIYIVKFDWPLFQCSYGKLNKIQREEFYRVN